MFLLVRDAPNGLQSILFSLISHAKSVQVFFSFRVLNFYHVFMINREPESFPLLVGGRSNCGCLTNLTRRSLLILSLSNSPHLPTQLIKFWLDLVSLENFHLVFIPQWNCQYISSFCLPAFVFIVFCFSLTKIIDDNYDKNDNSAHRSGFDLFHLLTGLSQCSSQTWIKQPGARRLLEGD